MNRVLINILLTSLFLLQSAQAQVKEKAHSDSMNTILFKVNSQKHQHTSYLFGTHHAFGKVFFDSLAIANQALASSDLLIKENLNIPGEMAEDIINRRTEITQWKKYLSNEDLAYIENLFATSPTDYNKMTPTEMYAFLNRYFKQQVCLNKTINNTSLSLDDYIGTEAEKLNIELVQLTNTLRTTLSSTGTSADVNGTFGIAKGATIRCKFLQIQGVDGTTVSSVSQDAEAGSITITDGTFGVAKANSLIYIDGSSNSAILEGKVLIDKYPEANQTIYLDLDRILTAGAAS